MNKSTAFAVWAAPLLGLAFYLSTASNASAQSYGWYYPGKATFAAPAPYGYGVGVVATPYGYAYNPRRAYRQSLRYGLPPLAAMPVPAYVYPYYYAPFYAPRPYLPSPPRGPSDYFYQPRYQQPSPSIAPAPKPAMPNPPQLPPEQWPEVIPTPIGE